MTLRVDVQFALEDDGSLPESDDLMRWAEGAARVAESLGQASVGGEPVHSGDERTLTLRVVGVEEGARLNAQFRGKARPTNVLSFPYEAPPGFPGSFPLLGDIVICGPVVASEADSQGKPRHDHWAHLVVHGVLHLMGFDHIDKDEAGAMEELERVVLRRFGIPDPYAIAT